MSEPTAYGKSYGDVVVHSFRKNRNARIALWISVLMIVLAALTPLIANNMPFYFKGTMGVGYEKSFKAASRGAYYAMRALPARLKAETERFQEKKATLGQFIRRMNDEEGRTTAAAFRRLRKRAESIPEIRGRWISQDVTLMEILEEMTPEERPALENARTRIIGDLPELYQKELKRLADSFSSKLAEMSEQLDPSMAPMAGAIEEKLRKAVAGDYLQTKEDRKAQLKEAVDALKTEFDPKKVTLIPKWRMPLIHTLKGSDVFFITATLLTLLAFGPLTWWKLKKITPIERRWKITWILALAPAVVLSILWYLSNDPKFQTMSYKQGVEDGSITMESSLWPPISYRFDEVPDDQSERLAPPSWKHLFGTDFMGRDLFTRMLWGSRVSLLIGFVAAFIAVSLGVVMGVLSGYHGRWVDIVISRIIEIKICFPYFFAVLAVVAFMGGEILYVMVVLGIFGWMGIARLQRGEILRLLRQDFVIAGMALGASNARIMFRHLLPNALAPVLVAGSFFIASAMLAESGLSFLGFGVTEPNTSWGQILYTGRDFVPHGTKFWWTFTIPGAAIFVAVTCYNLVGDGIRDAVDPRLKS